MYDKTVRRRRAVLGLLVGCSLILLTAYFGEPSGGVLHGLQRGVVNVVSPIQDGASRALKPVRDLFGWVGDTVSAKGDLKDTTQDRDRWRAEAIRNEAAVRENAKLRGQLDLDQQLPNSIAAYGPVMASVTGQSPTLWYATLQINKGTSSGVRDGMPVIASDGDKGDEGGGLIGKVDSTGPDWAKIRLITDSQMAVGADTVGGGARGVLKPTPGNPRDLILEYSGKDDAVRKGDVVVTAGTTSARNDLLSPFPKDVPIGRVTKIDDPGSEQQEVHVRPFVDITRVEYVQVLTQKVNDNR